MNNLENCIILKQNKDGTIRLSRLNKKSIEFGNCKQENDLLKYGYSTYVWFSYSKKLKSFLKLDYPVQTDMRLYNVCIDTICSKYLETVYIKPYQKRGDIT